MYAPSSNRLTSRPQGPVTLDGAGHTTAQAGFSYTWDGDGRLKTVSLSGTLLATYHYDHRGRRTRKETTAAAPQGVATVLYTYDGNDHLLAETDAGGPIRSYLWRDDTPVAQIEHRPTRKVLYLETDHLGTPTAARNEAGVLIWRWASDAFGSSLPDEDPDGDGQATAVNLRYPGQYFDPESGLHYNQARYYDPTSGRYLSPDPIGLAGGVNTYLYANANPLRFTDPDGLEAVIPFPWPGSVVGAGATGVGGAAAAGVAVAGAGFAGYGIGTLIYPRIEPMLSKAIDSACNDKDDQFCKERYELELQTCRALGRAERVGRVKSGSAARCYESAEARFWACSNGRPEPPFHGWPQ